jgi:hypothetical protein
LELLGSGDGSTLTSEGLGVGVGRSKYGLPNGNRVASSSQSGLTHSERGTNVDIKTVPTGGDVPVRGGRFDLMRFSAISGAGGGSGSGSSALVGGGFGTVSFESEARVGFLAAIVASVLIDETAGADGTGSAGVVGVTDGVRESMTSSFSPTLDIYESEPSGS